MLRHAGRTEIGGNGTTVVDDDDDDGGVVRGGVVGSDDDDDMDVSASLDVPSRRSASSDGSIGCTHALGAH